MKPYGLLYVMCWTVSNNDYPKELLSVCQDSFLDFFDYYENVCQTRLNFTGESMVDPFFGEYKGSFIYADLMKRLYKIKARLLESKNLSGS